MEVSSFSSDVAALRKRMASSAVKALAFEAVLAAQRSVLCLLLLTGALLKGVDDLPELTLADKRFPLDELHSVAKPGPENKDASDTEDDDDEDEDDDQDDDDAGDEDFSGEEGGDGDAGGDPEDDPEANGNEGSDDEDDDDEDGDEDEDGEDEDEEDEEEDEDEEDQPPAKKRK